MSIQIILPHPHWGTWHHPLHTLRSTVDSSINRRPDGVRLHLVVLLQVPLSLCRLTVASPQGSATTGSPHFPGFPNWSSKAAHSPLVCSSTLSTLSPCRVAPRARKPYGDIGALSHKKLFVLFKPCGERLCALCVCQRQPDTSRLVLFVLAWPSLAAV